MIKLQAISLTIFTLMQFTSLSTWGQIVNIEKFRIDKDTSGVWFGNIGVRFNFEKQKSDILSFQINSNVVYLSELNSYIMINKVNFIKVSGTEVISEGYIHLRANFLRRKVLSIEPFAQYQYDQNRGLDARFISGAGMRYSVHTTETLNIAVNTGVMYEYERWTDTIKTIFLKSTSNINLRYSITKNLAFIIISYYQARPKYFLKPRIIANSKLLFSINKTFSFSIDFAASYDSAPIIPIEKFILSLGNGVILKF